MLDYRIETFLEVCETLNYTKAAENLGLSQPAVSQHIRLLEEEYGIKLFERKGRKVRLTDRGMILRQALLQFRSDERKLRDRLRETEAGEPPLRMGATITIGNYYLVGPLSRYMKKHPDREVWVTVADTKELTEMLMKGEIDTALIEGNFDREEFDGIVAERERFIAAASARHQFKKKPRSLSDLFGERLLVREPGSGTREILERELALDSRSVADFAGRIRVNSTVAIVAMLKRDLGVSFLYEAAVRDGIRDGSLMEIPLEDFRVSHDFTFIWNRGSVFEPGYRKLAEEFFGSRLD